MTEQGSRPREVENISKGSLSGCERTDGYPGGCQGSMAVARQGLSWEVAGSTGDPVSGECEA